MNNLKPASSTEQRFSAGQKRVFLLCFLSYSIAYTGRLNLSAVLSSLSTVLHLSDAQAGMFQTVFALTYAAGQIVNGSLVDKISARRFIGLGLVLSAVFNLLFVMVANYPMKVVLWALNGAAQSMLWTPIVKLLTTWFHGERRNRASFGLSVTMILGHLAAWGVSGVLGEVLDWRYAFFVPAIIMCLTGLIVQKLLRDHPHFSDEPDSEAQAPIPVKTKESILYLMRFTGLGALLLCCVCNGFVRDGILTWAPSILARKTGGKLLDSTLLSLIIPVINLTGVLIIRRCYGLFCSNARRATGALLLISAVLALLLPVGRSGRISALLMGLCCAANYGINPMLTTLVPMEYEYAGRVGMVAGLMDCFIYLGSALSGVATGLLSDTVSWTWVYLVWGAVSALGAILSFLSIRGYRAMKNHNC